MAIHLQDRGQRVNPFITTTPRMQRHLWAQWHYNECKVIGCLR
jgi:hypothetical protein